MKTTCIAAIFALASLVATTVGCASRSNAGYLRGQTASDSLSNAANEIDHARRQLADTTTALAAIVNQPTLDLRTAFERYRTSLAALERTVTSVNNEADNMQKQGQKYFEHWNTQLAAMQNEDIRARSVARQQEVSRQFTQIQQQYQDVRQQFVPVMTSLRDIQKLLSADLTPAGVGAAREFAVRADAEATRVRQALDRVAESFRNMSGVLAPA